MCGRLCCYCKHSSYSKRLLAKFEGQKSLEWRDPDLFVPCSNIVPTGLTPVLCASDFTCSNEGRATELIIRPMKFGITLMKSSHLVHNVRYETLSSSTFFNYLVRSGKRCGIVCDGFFEWKTKRPYFFYDSSSQFEPSIIKHSWDESDWVDKGPPVMVLAGVYSVDSNSDKLAYSCSVITKEASSNTSEIHHRIPIVLETAEEMRHWISSGVEQSVNELVKLDKITNTFISFYEVSSKVNSSKYKGEDCNFPKSLVRDGFFMKWTEGSRKEKVDGKNTNLLVTGGIKSGCTPSAQAPLLKTQSKRKADDAPSTSTSKRQTSISDWLKKR